MSPKYDHNAPIGGDVLLPGLYEAVVKKATNKASKPELARAQSEGRDPVINMIELILTCTAPNGVESDVFDYLVFDPSMMFKVKHFCESAGLDYDGSLDDVDCVDRNVAVMLEVDTYNGKKKNKVIDYALRTSATRAPVRVSAASEEFDPMRDL